MILPHFLGPSVLYSITTANKQAVDYLSINLIL